MWHELLMGLALMLVIEGVLPFLSPGLMRQAILSLARMVETLASAGLHRPHIDLGHVGVFRGLAHEAELNDEQEQVLFDALQRKAKPEIEDYVDALAIDDTYRHMFVALLDLNGSADVLGMARARLRHGGREVQSTHDKHEHNTDTARRRIPDIALHFD